MASVGRFAAGGQGDLDGLLIGFRCGWRFGDDFHVTGHWHATMAQRQGTIRCETRFPKNISELALSGPHFFVGNPFSKTPCRECMENSHYDMLDLTTFGSEDVRGLSEGTITRKVSNDTHWTPPSNGNGV